VTRLGEILAARGAVSVDGLRSALEACRRHGGRLGTWLVRLGLISEATLLDALREQTGCPAAATLELATAPGEVRGLLSPAFARRNMVVAFGRQGRRLDVAMINPNDLMLLDEISGITGLTVRPHVATEAALSAALAIPLVEGGGGTAPPPPGPPRGTAREWRQFWRLESSPQELFKAFEGAALVAPEGSSAAFPSLVPRGRGTTGNGGNGLDSLLDALAAARHRDQVATLVLGHLQGFASRVALFSLHQGKVMGWAVRGDDVVEEDFHTLLLPLDRSSVFLQVSRGLDLHVGPLGEGEGNRLLVEALGPPPPAEAVVAPVRVRGKLAAFVWLDRGEETVAGIPLDTVRRLGEVLGLVLEVMVLRQKIRVAGRLTEGGGSL
jgi:MshEN domain